MSDYSKWAIPPKVVGWTLPYEFPQWCIDWLLERDRRDRAWACRMFMEGSFTREVTDGDEKAE